MLIYSSEKKNIWPAIARNMIITAVIITIAAIAVDFIWNGYNKNYYWLLSILILAAFVEQLNKEWIQDIQIDEVNKTISYHYRSPLNGDGEKVHILSQVQLYTKTRQNSAGNYDITSLSLYKQRRKVMELHTRANNFTPETLKAIREQLLRLGVTE